MEIRYTRDRFLESPETSRAHFGWHNSLCIFKTKASRGTTFWRYFNSNSLCNVWKDHLCRISGSEFYVWLFGSQKFRDVRETGPGPWFWVSPNACAHFVPFLSMFNQPLFFPLWLILYNCWWGRLSGSDYSFMLRWHLITQLTTFVIFFMGVLCTKARSGHWSGWLSHDRPAISAKLCWAKVIRRFLIAASVNVTLSTEHGLKVSGCILLQFCKQLLKSS